MNSPVHPTGARLLSRNSRAALAAIILGFTLLAAGCQHQALTTSAPPPPEIKPPALWQPDQVNTEGWDKAWTNLVNDVEQSFTPSVEKLAGVEVELLLGNEGEVKDELTLSVLDEKGQTLTTVTQLVPADDPGPVVFEIPDGGVDVTPGHRYRLRLSGGTTFGWKYVVGGYEKGEATLNGKPLLAQARSTFLFRTFGAK